MNCFHFTSHIKLDAMVPRLLLYSSRSVIQIGKLKYLLCCLAKGFGYIRSQLSIEQSQSFLCNDCEQIFFKHYLNKRA